MLPLLAPVGTVTNTLFVDQEFTLTGAPFRVIPPVPCDGPNPAPLILTTDPTAPLEGRSTLIEGRTVKKTPLLWTPPAVTVTLPLVAMNGTLAEMLVSLQEFTVAVTPLNFTFPLPWTDPNPLPEIVIGKLDPKPAYWLVGLSEVIVWPRAAKLHQRTATTSGKSLLRRCMAVSRFTTCGKLNARQVWVMVAECEQPASGFDWR